LKEALRGAKQGGAGGLLLDLRHNPGGLLDSVIDVTGQFIKDGVIVYQEDANGNRKAYNAKSGGLATDTPRGPDRQGQRKRQRDLSGALHDRQRGTLVGEEPLVKVQ